MKAMNMEKKMKKNILRVASLLTLALLSLIAVVPAAQGAVLFHENFEGDSSAGGTVYGGSFTSGKSGQGWLSTVDRYKYDGREFIEYDFDGGSLAEEGTIEFFLKRSRSALYPDVNQEGIVEFLDEAFRPILSIVVLWENSLLEDSKGDSALLVYGNAIVEVLGSDPWGGDIFPLGKKIGAGQWQHVAVTWGAKKSDHKVYLNGKPLNGVNKYGKHFTAKNETVASLLAETVYIRVGTETQSHDPDVTWSPLSNSVVDEMKVHDVAFNPYRDPAEDVAATISSLDHNGDRVAGFSGKLVAGDVMTVAMEGTPGAAASFDVARLADIRGEIPVSWRGWGVYLEDITFFEDDQVDLGDVEEYRVFVDTSPIGEITLDTESFETLEVEEQSIVLEGLEAETPYYVAVMALMDDDRLLPVIESVQGLAMSEVEGAPGSYEGTYTFEYQDRYPEAVVVGRMGSGEAAAVMASDELLEVDPALTIQVISSVDELKADEESTAEIKVTVTDANDDPVSGHEVRFVLATTSQYTGVVGGGSFTDEVGGSLSRDFWGETDLFGQVTATYTAGFAAKTAIIVARDMMSNDVGAGYVKTYIEASAELELEAVQEVAGKALGYTITVTSSDEWLTADGESEARITALVAQNGIPVEGHRVSFRVTAGTGKIRTVDGETGRDGKARAVYTAGKKIGIVLITAVDQTVGISGSVQIELRSDAPAKIAITLTPDLLPADGRSTADIEVVVTDINDNPNEGIEVEYEVEIGSGRLRNIDEVTDRRGESAAEYVAGRMPGKVSIKVTVRSTMPTEEEMAEARALATAVTDYDFF